MEIRVFGRGAGVIVPSTTLTVVPAIGLTWLPTAMSGIRTLAQR